MYRSFKSVKIYAIFREKIGFLDPKRSSTLGKTKWFLHNRTRFLVGDFNLPLWHCYYPLIEECLIYQYKHFVLIFCNLPQIVLFLKNFLASLCLQRKLLFCVRVFLGILSSFEYHDTSKHIDSTIIKNLFVFLADKLLLYKIPLLFRVLSMKLPHIKS